MTTNLFLNDIKEKAKKALPKDLLVEQLLDAIPKDIVSASPSDVIEFNTFIDALARIGYHSADSAEYADFSRTINALFNRSVGINPFIIPEMILLWIADSKKGVIGVGQYRTAAINIARYLNHEDVVAEVNSADTELQKHLAKEKFMADATNMFLATGLAIDTPLIELLATIPTLSYEPANNVNEVANKIANMFLKYEIGFVQSFGDITRRLIQAVNGTEKECIEKLNIFNTIGNTVLAAMNNRNNLSGSSKQAFTGSNANHQQQQMHYNFFHHPGMSHNPAAPFNYQPFNNNAVLPTLTAALDALAKAQLNVIDKMVQADYPIGEISLITGLTVVMIEQLILFHHISKKQPQYGPGLYTNSGSPFQKDFDNFAQSAKSSFGL